MSMWSLSCCTIHSWSVYFIADCKFTAHKKCEAEAPKNCLGDTGRLTHWWTPTEHNTTEYIHTESYLNRKPI